MTTARVRPGGRHRISFVGPDGIVQVMQDGCDVAPACLDCPLPVCKHDDKDWYIRWKSNRRYRRIVEDVRGLGPHEAARRLGISERTVHRAREWERKAEKGVGHAHGN
ncbi:MAG: hypothetical protein WD533_06540 [Dehalococcoidia bacterium]